MLNFKRRLKKWIAADAEWRSTRVNPCYAHPPSAVVQTSLSRIDNLEVSRVVMFLANVC
jgi:hypothetical protein